MPTITQTPISIWTPQVVAALIALLGVIIGIFIKDIFMAMHLAQQKRVDELNDKASEKAEMRFDLMRIYAEPLLDAAASLFYRLDEIVVKKQGRYLRAGVPSIPFLEYKKISTLYRIAVLLGWMRAIKRERGYLDPRKSENANDVEMIGRIESALADGAHIDRHRLDEFSALWKIPSIEDKNKVKIGYRIDSVRADYLAAQGHLSAVDLNDDQKKRTLTNVRRSN